MELKGEISRIILELDAESRIFGREESRNTRTVQSDGIRILIVCGVYRQFKPRDVDNF
jgi:hypothetical protein